jgi:hypothetical protein
MLVGADWNREESCVSLTGRTVNTQRNGTYLTRFWTLTSGVNPKNVSGFFFFGISVVIGRLIHASELGCTMPIHRATTASVPTTSFSYPFY